MWNVRSASVSALSAGLLLLGGAARAEGGAPTVTVVPYTPLFGGAPQSTADKVTEQIGSELAASNSGNDFAVAELVAGEKKAEKKVAEDPIAAAKKKLAPAIAQLEKGQTLAAGRKFKPAADELEKGITAFLATFQGADDFKPLSDAYVQLALARLKLGNDDGAAKALDDLIRLDPERVLASPAVPKQLADQHAKQREALLAKSRGILRIDSAPAGAKIRIDGRDVGETPLMAQGVLSGAHYIRVTKDGLGGAWEKVTVGTDLEKVSFTLAEEHASGPLATMGKSLGNNVLNDDVLKAAQQIGKSSKAEYVVFGALRKNSSTETLDVKSFGVRTKDGAVAILADLGFDQELLGANIEILKLVGDLTQKIQGGSFAASPGTLPVFDGVAAPKAESPSVVQLAPAGVGAAVGSEEGGSQPSGGTTGGVRRGRGPVTAAEPEPETTPKAVVTPKEEEGGSVLEQLQKRRERKRLEEEAPVKSGSDEESGENTKVKKKKVDEEVAADDEEAPKKVDLKATKKKKAKLSGLTPEELEKMKAAEGASTSSGGNPGPVILGVSLGVVGAAALGVGAYFLFSPKEAKTATAHVNW